MTKERVKITVFHLISAVLVAVSLCFTVFYFRNVARRTWQAVESFVRSLVYFVAGYAGANKDVSTTVQYIPEGIETLLPVTWEEVKAFACAYGRALISWGNFKAYNRKIGKTVFAICLLVMAFLIPVLALFGLISKQYKRIDNKHGERSIPLRIWNKLEDIFYYPVKKFVLDFIFFFLDIKDEEGNVIESRRARRLWLKGLALIWAWNLNFITIILEGLAWFGYILWSYKFGNVFVQIAKLAVDLTVALDFLPWWIIATVGYILFNRYRENIGYARLNEREEDNREFLIEHPGSIVATGAPRVGKTQTITDMSISQQIIYRQIAFEKIIGHTHEFPHFPWGVLEQSVTVMRDSIPNFSLTNIRQWVKGMKQAFYGFIPFSKAGREMAIKRLQYIGYQGDDFIFNYNYKRYGLTFCNGLTDLELFDVIEVYALQYYIYTCPTPLMFGNYPIRTDIRWIDFGNMPLMDADIFRRTPRDIKLYSQHSHVINHDGLRLGEKMDPNGAYNDSYDIGVCTISELGKEVGNQKTNSARADSKKTNADGEPKCTPHNDLWTLNAKMISHACTIDYETYFRIFADEQREMSILADFRELGSEMNIQEKHKERILMPFFAYEELLYVLSSAVMKKLLLFFKVYHGKETLLAYLAKQIYGIIYRHYIRVYNTFSSYQVEFVLKNNSKGEEKKDGQTFLYNLSRKKICANVYDTGFFGTFYRAKFKRSKVGGLSQTPMFDSLTPTIAQMKFMKSHFNEEIFKHFGISA